MFFIFRYIKDHKRRLNRQRPSVYIPISNWNNILRGHDDFQLNFIPETDLFPLLPPPTLSEVEGFLTDMKNGTAAGTDGIKIELIKYLPDELLVEIVDLLQDVWISNVVPEEWTVTIQVPIPKISRPLSVDNYRRITLSNSGYKLYAKFLLFRLEQVCGDVPEFQAAFTRDMSVDDHVFVTRRVLEECWRAGERVYVASLDIEKAFDNVEYQAVIGCLLRSGVPHFLVNRIISTCFHEYTSLMWYGQSTDQVRKVKGVKQGCPLSPFLFNLVIDYSILDSMEMAGLRGSMETGTLLLPLVLAFADDVIIVSQCEGEIQRFVECFKFKLGGHGLALNQSKSTILIRDPLRGSPNVDTYIIGDLEFKKVETMRYDSVKLFYFYAISSISFSCSRYLGSFMTEGLNRKGNTRSRCHLALGLSKSLVSFFSSLNPPWQLVIKIYERVLCPVLEFGMKASALTKGNRTMLRKYERLIVSGLLTCVKDVPIGKKREVLDGRTITSKVRKARVRYWGHVLRRDPNSLLQGALDYKKDRKKVGRPCFTWLDSLLQDVKRYGNQVSWEQLVADKEKLADFLKETETEETDSE